MKKKINLTDSEKKTSDLYEKFFDANNPIQQIKAGNVNVETAGTKPAYAFNRPSTDATVKQIGQLSECCEDANTKIAFLQGALEAQKIATDHFQKRVMVLEDALNAIMKHQEIVGSLVGKLGATWLIADQALNPEP